VLPIFLMVSSVYRSMACERVTDGVFARSISPGGDNSASRLLIQADAAGLRSNVLLSWWASFPSRVILILARYAMVPSLRVLDTMFPNGYFLQALNTMYQIPQEDHCGCCYFRIKLLRDVQRRSMQRLRNCDL